MSTALVGDEMAFDQIQEMREVFAKFHPVLQTTTDRKGKEDTVSVFDPCQSSWRS